ncbi:GyrI-like domain-containing protein [Aggregatibacter kilianii]|uniref:GyrI-like domain-containing protein n=1 Tax=Aggregatibacter kilianii TaxID=2025884 RepID=UPI000D6439E6|nr:GyrI-like domain-containing protein [Aggregatibacter kilianii]
MKYEWKKIEKNLYGVKQKPELIAVPSQNFIMIQGSGNPNEADFSDRVSALYSLAYSIKMLFKSIMKNESDDVIKDFSVYPLEGIWEKAEGEVLDKDKLKYTLMIKQPDFITQEIFINALENIQKKKLNALYDEINFGCINDGKAIQILHVGSYDNEPISFEKMNELTKELGLVRTNCSHREIYLSNKNKTAEAKLKTILRYSVR